MSDAEKGTWFYLATLIPPAIVLASAAWAALRRRRVRLHKEDLLTLATAPPGIAAIVVFNTSLHIPGMFPGLFWIDCVYFIVGTILSLALVVAGFFGRRTFGARQQCEVVFCLLYFGAHCWVLWPFWVLGGVPPL